MASHCALVGEGRVRFCIECPAYPCKRLKSLDKRYRTKYHMSMIENLNFIRDNGMTSFLKREEEKWRCPNCGSVICCHNGLCLTCDRDTFLKNKKYRWDEESKMDSLNQCIQEYTFQLRKGQIQKAYKGIMMFMTGLSQYLQSRHPDYAVSALYFGYMDMTYFAFTPPDLKNRKLKIAMVYLHEERRFEAWLGGVNRKVQAETIDLLSQKEVGPYKRSTVSPGVDSILETILVEQPDFEQADELKEQIEAGTMKFIEDLLALVP